MRSELSLLIDQQKRILQKAQILKNVWLEKSPLTT